MKPIQTAGVIGLGSLGVLYATLFTRALGKEQVPVLADGARIARYRKQGFWYNDAPCDFNYTDAAARTEPVDLLLFAVKFVGLQNAIETCRHLVGPDTLVISVLNGISSEEILGDAFGPEHVVWCVAERMAAKKEGNRVVCDPIGELAVGVPAGEDTSRLHRLPLCRTGGHPHPHVEQAAVQHRLQPGRPGVPVRLRPAAGARKAPGHHDRRHAGGGRRGQCRGRPAL